MDAWVRSHQALILSTLYVLIALFAAGYSVFYSSMRVYGTALESIAQKIGAENRKIEDVVKLAQEQNAKGVGIGLRSLPWFLARINQIAHENNVIINRLSPDEGDVLLKFNLKFVADYNTFLRFTAKLEELDILLDDIQVHPYDYKRTPPLHAISFSLIPQNNAEPLSGKRLQALESQVASKDKRDPFQRFAYNKLQKTVEQRIIDLTWVYKLEGLGTTPDSRPYAMINRQSYHIGDELDGRKITDITERVYLQKEDRDGTIKFVLAFQDEDKDKKGKK